MTLGLQAKAAPMCQSLFTTHTKAEYVRPWGGLIAIHKKKQFLSAEDRHDIREIFNDTEMSINYKLMRALQIYNEARLKNYAPAERAQVKETLDSLSVHFGDGPMMANAERVQVPHELMNTAILMGILAHEREHRAQVYRYSGAFKEAKMNPKNLALLVVQTYGIRTKYLMERDAMRAEWEALNSLPPEAIQHSVDIVEKTPMPADFKNLMIRMLKNSRLSQDQYIKAEHKNGRYSHKQNFIDSSKNILMLIGNLLFLSAPIYFLI